MTHKLKVNEPYFTKIRIGHQTCDLCRNDREFHIGDIAILQRYKRGEFTGEVCSRRITYVIADCHYCPKGYVLLGLSDYGVTERLHDERFIRALDAVFAA